MPRTTTMTVRVSGALSEFVATNVGEDGAYGSVRAFVLCLSRGVDFINGVMVAPRFGRAGTAIVK